MKALTVFPEHAELFRLGIRTIETRAGRTNHRGPLAIRASMRDPDSATARRDPIGCAAMGAIPHGNPLPMGAITSVVDVLGCLPIESFCDGQEVIVVHDDGTLDHAIPGDRSVELGDDPPAALIRDISDQRPFGDFRPGRWGWMFAIIRPLAEPVPSPCLPGMFDLRPDVEAAVRAQLREVVAS